MTVQLELWQLLTILIAFFGCVAGFAKVILAQIDKRLDVRFDAQEKAQNQSEEKHREMLAERVAKERALDERIRGVDEKTLSKLGEIGQRLSAVESSLEHGFGRGEAESIYERINEVAEDLAELKGEFRGVSDNLKLLVNKITEKGLSA